MARAHRTSLVPQFDAFPLTWTHDGSRQDSTTDSGYVSTVAAEQGYSDAIFLKSQGGREIVTILGPVCYKTMRYACNSETPKIGPFYVRWETLATGTQNYFGIAHIDSIEPTVPAQNYYNLSIADDANGNVLACWTENIGGSEIWCQAFDASRNKIGTPLQVEALAGTRDRISEGIHRTYAIGAMDVGHFMITYSQNNRIYLRSIQLGAGSISRGSARLVSPAGNFCAFPNLAINSNHIAVAYFRHAPDASNRRIEIIRMERQGLSLPVADTTIRILPRNITFTTQLTERRFQQSYNSPAIAVDTLGNILVGYNYEMDARITSFVNVPVYFNNGAYTSNALELRHPLATSPLTSGDSVQFTALQLMGERTNAAQVFYKPLPKVHLATLKA
jgi:hypothetical protein